VDVNVRCDSFHSRVQYNVVLVKIQSYWGTRLPTGKSVNYETALLYENSHEVNVG